MPIRILELHHHAVRIGVTPAEVEAARQFYTDLLGLSLDDGRSQATASPGHWINVDAHSQIHTIAAPTVSDDEGATKVGIDPRAPHVALAVGDIAEALEEVKRNKVSYIARRDRATGALLQVFLRDPAGNVIELHQIDSCRCTARSRLPAQVDGTSRAWGAVMFADMRGFTAVAERLPASDIVPLLNQYFALLSRITHEHGGTVFSLAGDGVLAGFGLPHEQHDASERAVHSAQEMLEGFRALADDWKTRLDVNTGLGIGISAGEVIVGNVGAPGCMSYTIIGDTVNVASRLSQRARAGEALFSSVVKRSMDERGHGVAALAIPALQLRGRTAPIDIYCLAASERVDFRP